MSFAVRDKNVGAIGFSIPSRTMSVFAVPTRYVFGTLFAHAFSDVRPGTDGNEHALAIQRKAGKSASVK